jgi:hypothetical protein
MSVVVFSAVVFSYLVGAGLAFGVVLRLRPRKGHVHVGYEWAGSLTCTGTDTCVDCRSAAMAVSVVWPFALALTVLWLPLRTAVRTGNAIARLYPESKFGASDTTGKGE